jgi:hypothetical protein
MQASQSSFQFLNNTDMPIIFRLTKRVTLVSYIMKVRSMVTADSFNMLVSSTSDSSRYYYYYYFSLRGSGPGAFAVD